MTSDPIGLDGGLNTYGYVYGNPVRYVDIYGLEAGAEALPDININTKIGIPAWARSPFGFCVWALTHSSAVGEGSDITSCNDVSDTGITGEAANDSSCNGGGNYLDDCNLVDADVNPTPDHTTGNVTNLGKEVTCWYECPGFSGLLGRQHFIASELSSLINTKAQALAWCPKKPL